MIKRSLILAIFLVGCGGRVSLGDHGSGNDPLSGAEREDTGAPAEAGLVADTGVAAAADAAPAAPVATQSDIDYIEIEETGAIYLRVRVDSTCRVTDHKGLDVTGNAARCSELFAIALDTTPYTCGPNSLAGTVRIHLHDGRDLVRDLSADRCSVLIPSLPTHKHVHAVYGRGDGS